MSCANKFILKFGPITQGYDIESMVVVDPAELRFINGNTSITEAIGFSKEIYTTLGVKGFRSIVKKTLVEPLTAIYEFYEIVPSQPLRVIHVVGPIFLDKKNDSIHRLNLKQAYLNMFLEFFQNSEEGEVLRMVPLSVADYATIFSAKTMSNIELPSAYGLQERVDLTVSCLFESLTKAERVTGKKCSHIELFTLDVSFFRALEQKLREDGIPLLSDV
jgi:hypothetical protein